MTEEKKQIAVYFVYKHFDIQMNIYLSPHNFARECRLLTIFLSFFLVLIVIFGHH